MRAPGERRARMVEVKKVAVEVVYNGVGKSLKYRPKEKTKALLEDALKAFDVQSNRHLMSLFNAAGQELEDHESLEDAGVKPGDILVLRPSTVRGGRG
jgi:hypothetical protein